MAAPPPRGGPGDRDAELADEVIDERNEAIERAEQEFRRFARGNVRTIDGTSHPSHARGVSVKTPEIISIFDFLPLYNNSNPPVISKGGKLFDIQVNARRIRIQQLYSLLEELSKDSSSPMAKIVEQLKAEMIEEMKGAQNDFILYRSIHDAFYGFLNAFDLKENEDQIQAVMQRLRDQRNESVDPSLVNSTISDVSRLTDLLVENHGFTNDLIENSSNTKLLYYVMSDLKSMLLEAGPGFIARLRSQRAGISFEQFRYQKLPENLPRNRGFSKVFKPRFDPDNLLRTRLYHPGRLGLSLWSQGRENEGDRADLGENLGFYSTEDELGLVLGDDPRSVAMLLSTAIRDMAISSGIASTEYEGLIPGDLSPEQALFRDFPTGRSDTNILESPRSLQNLNPGSIALATKSEPAVTQENTRPTPLFDPGVSEAPQGTQIVSLKELTIDQLLNTGEGQEFDFTAIDNVLGSVEGMTTLASAFESLIAIDNPALQPEPIFKKILNAFSSCLSRLNPERTAAGYNDGDFLDLALLSECTKNLDSNGKFPDTTLYAQSIIPMIDLINLLLYEIGLDNGYYSNTVLRPGATLAGTFGGERIEKVNPNFTLSDQITRQITSYLLTRHEHYSEFFQPREGFPDSRTFNAFSSKFSGVYFDRFHNQDNHEKRAATEPDGRDAVYYNAADSGYWNVRNDNTLFVPEGSNNQAKLKGAEVIRTLLDQAVEGRRESIFRDIVSILNEIDAAASQRSEYFEFDDVTQRNHMKYSKVDTSVIGSFILKCCSIMSRVLTTVTFNEARHPGANEFNGRYVWLITDDRQQLEDFNADLINFRNQGDEAFQNFSPTNQAFIGEVLSNLRDSQKLMLDATGLLNGVSQHIQEASADFIQSLRSDSPAGQLIQRQKGKLISIVDPSQQAVAQNKYEQLASRIQNNQLFDPFLQTTDVENTVLSFGKTNELTREGFGDNLKILAVGVPDGFSRNVLGYRLLSNNPQHRRTKVRVKVHRHDILLNNTILRFGESPPGRERDGEEQFKITFKPKEFDFDLRLFFKGLSPLSSPVQDVRVSQLDNENNVTSDPVILDERQLLSFESLIRGNFILRRFDDNSKTFSDITFPFTSNDAEKQIFENHAFDFIAKTYIQAMTGAKLEEETFLIDKQREQGALAPDEIARFLTLINDYMNSIIGGANIDNYLAGSRATRELLNRLQGHTPSSPIVESIVVTDNGIDENANVKLTEDLIRFSKMISPQSLLFGPSSTRQSIVEPKLFERVFCMLIDPDSFEIDFIDPEFKNALVNAGLIQPDTNPPVLSQITTLMAVPQFNQFYVELI